MTNIRETYIRKREDGDQQHLRVFCTKFSCTAGTAFICEMPHLMCKQLKCGYRQIKKIMATSLSITGFVQVTTAAMPYCKRISDRVCSARYPLGLLSSGCLNICLKRRRKMCTANASQARSGKRHIRCFKRHVTRKACF
jgi:hypothetical protein